MDIVFVTVMDCQDAAGERTCLNFNTWTQKNQRDRKRRGSKRRWGRARMKEKKNHFLTSVYSHSVPELQISNQPRRNAAPDPRRNLKALEVRGH